MKNALMNKFFCIFAPKYALRHTMSKRLLLLIALMVGVMLPSHAVLKEDSLVNTLSILRQELTKYHDEYSARQKNSKMASQKVFMTLKDAVQKSNQNALMLYSQKDGYVFDLTYACHEAIEQHREFESHLFPFKSYVEKANVEVTRYDSLISALRAMPVMFLDEKAKTDRSVCLALAVNIRRMLVEDQQQLSEYIYYYQNTDKRLRYLSDYANRRYTDIQNSIFRNGGDSYFTILSNLGSYFRQTKESVDDKYVAMAKTKTRSQWDPRIIIFMFVIIAFYGVVAVILNQLVVRWMVTRLLRKKRFEGRANWFMEKRKCIIMATTVVTFAIILGIVHGTIKQSFILMASNLLVEYSWLLSVILISLLIRVSAQQIMSTFRIYTPLVVMGFIVITFRIILIPNDLVNLIFPPLLLICCLWQWNVLSRHNQNIDRIDMVFAYISQLVFVISLVSSVVGYTLLAVQILIWWIMQLACILTVTCIRDWFKKYSEDKKLADLPVTQNWHYRLFYWVLLPSCSVCSVMLSLYWAADVFNLSDLTWQLFTRPFIDVQNFRASIFGLSQIIIMWFVFNYINHTAKAFAKMYFEKKDSRSAASRIIMVNNVMQVLIWGIWFLATLAVFHVSNTWIEIVSGGLATGLGFASKDILENIYYGISLMAGRIRIGDLIVCDGIRGTVTSITYTSTMITATDGSVIAFTNSQLFTKNYKNLTRNHGYECHILDVGVAYGTDAPKCRQLLLDAVNSLKCVHNEGRQKTSVVLKELGDSAIIFKVLVWVNVRTQYVDDGEILECIYKTLNENNIEIPFPQTDVHMRTE